MVDGLQKLLLQYQAENADLKRRVQLLETKEYVKIGLTQDTTFYVTTTGDDDTGNGSITNPFASIQGAIDYLAVAINANGFTITVEVGAGTYTNTDIYSIETKIIENCPSILICGDTTTPSNVVIRNEYAGALARVIFSNQRLTLYEIEGFKFQIKDSTNARVVNAGKGTNLALRDWVIDSIPTGTGSWAILLFCTDQASLNLRFGTNSVEGNGTPSTLLWATELAIINVRATTIDFNNSTLNFTGRCVYSDSLSYVNAQDTTWSNIANVTGQKYRIIKNSVYEEAPGPTTPGDVAGSTASGGQVT